MASILMMGAGALVNALAFSGSNFLFHKLDSKDEEMKRHNEAMEELTKKRDKWNKDRMERLDYINKKRREAKEAEYDLSQIDKAMIEYHKVTNTQEFSKPNLEDIIKNKTLEAKKQIELESIAIGSLIMGIGFYIR